MAFYFPCSASPIPDFNDEQQKSKERRDAEFHQFVSLAVNVCKIFPSYSNNQCNNLMQTPLFNGVIMGTILLNCITIAMETTSLRTSIPLFFISTDAIFLGMFTIEFVMKVLCNPNVHAV